MVSLKQKIKNAPVLYRSAVVLKRVYLRFVGKRHAIQSTKTDHSYKLITLGSKNCGWTCVDDPALHNGVIISAGLGEDGSFDAEFAAKFSATVHIVDPTPRAIEHFKLITNRLGAPREVPFSSKGRQEPESYALEKVTEGQLHLHKYALWSEIKKVKFFLPKNTAHVSHSIVNFQNSYAENTSHIEVDAITMSGLFEKIGVNAEDIQLLKLDIEGAEIEVIKSMVAAGFLPKQILVEFDEFNVPTRRGIKRIAEAHSMLVHNGYKIVLTDGEADFLYLRDEK